MGFTGGGGNDNRFRMVVKEVDTVRDDDDTTADDPELTLPVKANTRYIWICMTCFVSDTLPDFKNKMNVPSGTAGRPTFGNWSSANFGSKPTMASTYFSTVTNTLEKATMNTGSITTGSTAGDIAMAWAQTNKDPLTDTTVFANSYLIVIEVGPA